MTNTSLLLMAFCLIIIILFADKILSKAVWVEGDPPIKINYPSNDATMFETYTKLAKEIEAATDMVMLDLLWIDIIIFQGSYKSADLVFSHLMLQYNMKNQMLKSLSC
jgi:hypothetical protein